MSQVTPNKSTPPNTDDLPTVVDPALANLGAGGSSATQPHHPHAGMANGPNLEQQQTVISRNPGSGSSEKIHSSVEMGAALVGRSLGHFYLEDFIGGGGMGAVFRAQDTMLGRTVAVKVLSRDQGGDDDTLRRFKNEAQSAARLDHDNIARVHYVGVDDGWNFIVFEFIEGENLREVVERVGPLPVDEAILFTLQVAEALDHAAHRDVVHRDIKPSNVLITPDGRAKLVDMGLARLHQVEAGQSDITASGVTLGTFDYISPEQARDPRLADVRSDLYSLGCTLYFMLTGRPPFPEGTVLQKLLSHSSEPPPDPKLSRSDIPNDVTKLVHRLLAKKPGDRFQDPGQLIKELSRIANQLGMESAPVTAYTEPNPRRHVWLEHVLPWAAPLAVLLLIVGGMELFSRWEDPDSHMPTFVAPPFADDSGSTERPKQPKERPPVDGDASPQDSGSPKRTDGASGNDADSTTDGGEDVDSPQPPDGGTEGGESENTDGGERTGTLPPKEIETDGGEDTAPPTPAVVKPRALVIGPESIREGLAQDEIWAASLNEALADLRIWNLLGKLDTVELRYNGWLDQQPIELPVDIDLVIRAGEGFQPGLRFAPQWNGELLPRPAMFELQTGQLELRDVALEMKLPQSRLYDRWSFFELRPQDELKLTRCVITVVNADEDGLPLHPGAAAVFDLISTLHANARMMDEMGRLIDESPVVPIKLDDCVVRGEAHLIRCPESMPFTLRWDNGLYVSGQKMIQVGGTRGELDEAESPIRIGLRKVTAILPNGMALFSDSENYPKQLPIELALDQCIVISEATEPLLEHRGQAPLRRYDESITVEGGGNFFEDVDVFWLINAAEASREFDWDYWRTRFGGGGMKSYTGEVEWAIGADNVDSLPTHTRLPQHYLLEPIDSNEAFKREAGFDPTTLPKVLREPEPSEPSPPTAVMPTPEASDTAAEAADETT